MFNQNKLVIILVVLLIGSGVAMLQMYKQLGALKNPEKIAQEEVKKVVDEVSKLMVLPTNETPTIATVSDLTPLKGQLFFANASVGDKVLIYQGSAKAILYNPTLNKVVEVSPINLGANTSTKSTPVVKQEVKEEEKANDDTAKEDKKR